MHNLTKFHKWEHCNVCEVQKSHPPQLSLDLLNRERSYSYMTSVTEDKYHIFIYLSWNIGAVYEDKHIWNVTKYVGLYTFYHLAEEGGCTSVPQRVVWQSSAVGDVVIVWCLHHLRPLDAHWKVLPISLTIYCMIYVASGSTKWSFGSRPEQNVANMVVNGLSSL